MMVAFFLLLILAALRPRAPERLALDAKIWAAALVCAVAAMHWTASLPLADPLAPLYGFGLGALTGRTVLALAVDGLIASLREHSRQTGTR